MTNWTQQAVFYHIYPLGFCGAEQYHQEKITDRIFKVEEWIPHLLALNINAVYFGPVFESGEHGYDTIDYRVIDHRLGSNQSFAHVCDKLHEAGIRVVLDGVFNHVGRGFFAFQDVIAHGQASPYCSWFSNLRFDGQSPYQDGFTYDAWEGHYNLVKLNLYNEEVVSYLLDSVGMWMDEFHIDGLRLDAADCVDPGFFKRLRHYCKSRDEQFWLMGEIIHGDYSRWANDSMLDSVTNYECYKGLYSSHNEKNYFEIAYSLNRQFGNGGIYRSLTLYNFADNHDVNRLASTLQDDRDLYNVYTLLYTMPGIPSLYYGSEAGIKGIKQHGSDAGLRPCLQLDEVHAQPALQKHLATLAALHQLSPICDGSYEQVLVTNRQFVFLRRKDEERIYVALNLDEESYELQLPCSWKNARDLLSKEVYAVDAITLPAKTAMVLCESMDDPTASSTTVQNKPEATCAAPLPEPTPEKSEEAVIPAAASAQKEDMIGAVRAQTMELRPGKYQHFKGKHYSVLYTAKHSETLETYVVYRQLYGDGEVWIRPLSMFVEEVEVDGQKVPRFTYIGK